jgi:hypothetical protein
MKEFVNTRLDRCWRGIYPVVAFSGQNPIAVLHIIPLAAFTGAGHRADVLGVFDRFEKLKPMTAFRDYSPRLNLEGVVVISGGEIPSYTQLFRSGAIEAVCCVTDAKQTPAAFYAGYLERDVREAARHYLGTLAELGFPSPYFLFLSILRANGWRLVETFDRPSTSTLPIENPDARIPEVALYCPAQELDLSLREIFDTFRNLVSEKRSRMQLSLFGL